MKKGGWLLYVLIGAALVLGLVTAIIILSMQKDSPPILQAPNISRPVEESSLSISIESAPRTPHPSEATTIRGTLSGRAPPASLTLMYGKTPISNPETEVYEQSQVIPCTAPCVPPKEFSTSILFPSAGTYYYRIHAQTNASSVWSEQRSVLAQNTRTPETRFEHTTLVWDNKEFFVDNEPITSLSFYENDEILLTFITPEGDPLDSFHMEGCRSRAQENNTLSFIMGDSCQVFLFGEDPLKPRAILNVITKLRPRTV